MTEINVKQLNELWTPQKDPHSQYIEEKILSYL